jgi:hypothetical protein
MNYPNSNAICAAPCRTVYEPKNSGLSTKDTKSTKMFKKRYAADCYTKVESLMQHNIMICLVYFVLFVDKMVFPR